MNETRSLRIGDAERDSAISALGEHYAAGRLTKDEYEERAGRVWAARVDADLEPMFSDLPAAHDILDAGAGNQTARREPAWQHPRRMWFMVPFLVLAFGGVLFMVARGAPWLLFVFFWIWMCGGFGFRHSHRHRHHHAEVARFHGRRPSLSRSA